MVDVDLGTPAVVEGKGAAYVYYFDHRTPEAPAGATHAAELGYVFRTLDARGGQPRAEDTAMSELVSSYWTNFAKTGNPNGASLPKWPAFTEGEQRAMVFGRDVERAADAELAAAPGARQLLRVAALAVAAPSLRSGVAALASAGRGASIGRAASGRELSPWSAS